MIRLAVQRLGSAVLERVDGLAWHGMVPPCAPSRLPEHRLLQCPCERALCTGAAQHIVTEYNKLCPCRAPPAPASVASSCPHDAAEKLCKAALHQPTLQGTRLCHTPALNPGCGSDCTLCSPVRPCRQLRPWQGQDRGPKRQRQHDHSHRASQRQVHSKRQDRGGS